MGDTSNFMTAASTSTEGYSYAGDTYFTSKPPGEWQLVTFLKRKSRGSSSKWGWSEQYDYYELQISRIGNQLIRDAIYEKYKVKFYPRLSSSSSSSSLYELIKIYRISCVCK